MSAIEAEVEAAKRWCPPKSHRSARATIRDGVYKVGYDDTEFIYWMGHGDSWEAALADADRRKERTR